jgi:hypothetical protein
MTLLPPRDDETFTTILMSSFFKTRLPSNLLRAAANDGCFTMPHAGDKLKKLCLFANFLLTYSPYML